MRPFLLKHPPELQKYLPPPASSDSEEDPLSKPANRKIIAKKQQSKANFEKPQPQPVIPNNMTSMTSNVIAEEEKNFDTKCKYEFPSLPKPVVPEKPKEKVKEKNAGNANNQQKNKVRNPGLGKSCIFIISI